MTLDSTLSKALYQGNGSATQFPFSFKVWEPSQVRVTVAGGSRESTDVTAQCRIDLTNSGGVVTYPLSGKPLSENFILSITRNMPFIQDIDLVSASRFDAQVIEDGLDQATAERQQMREELSRAVILPPTSEETPADVVEDIYAARDQAGQSASEAATSAQAAAQSAEQAEAAAHLAGECREHACRCADRAEQAATLPWSRRPLSTRSWKQSWPKLILLSPSIRMTSKPPWQRPKPGPRAPKTWRWRQMRGNRNTAPGIGL